MNDIPSFLKFITYWYTDVRILNNCFYTSSAFNFQFYGAHMGGMVGKY